MACFITWWTSAGVMKEQPEERYTLGSPASVRLYHQIAATHRPIRSPGKTTFPKYMLARLISARQIVVLGTRTSAYLFYNGIAYYPPASSGFESLPCQDTVFSHMDVDRYGPRGHGANFLG